MKQTRITIKDIAKEFGVAVSTVSRALHNSNEVSDELKKNICDYAAAHHYQPNMLATSLRNCRVERTKTIGVIIPKFVHYFFSCVLSGIETTASHQGYSIMVAQSDEAYENEKKIMQRFNAARVCGVIVSLAKDTKQYDHFQELLNIKVPIVFYDRICTELKTSRVVVDDYAGAFEAVDYMIKTGCRRVAFLGSVMTLEIAKNRCNGYKDALLKNHIKIDERLIMQCDKQGDAHLLLPKLLLDKDRPDALFAINDDIAFEALQVCRELNLDVPKDVSICGFSNSTITKVCNPQLTSVEQRGYDVGVEAAKILINNAENKDEDIKIKNKIIETTLVVRGSTLPMPLNDNDEN